MYITDLMPHRLSDLWIPLGRIMSSQCETPVSSAWSDALIGCQWHHGDLETIREKRKQGQLRKLIPKICLWSPIHSLKLSSPDPARWNLPPSAQHSISEISVNCVWTHMSSPNQALPTLRMWGEFHLLLYPGVCWSWLTLARKSQLCALFLTPNSVTMKW